MYNIRN